MEIREELLDIVGKGYFFDSPETLESYAKDYSLTPKSIPHYVVQPKDSQEVQRIIKLAQNYRMPLIPSSSRVHFTGSTIPKEGGIILDLRRMDKIVKIDERNRFARIEPGVTWKHLQTELSKEGLMALNPFLPHSLQSVLSSHLENYPMLIASRYEFAEPLLTMELIFPDGEFFRTGSASVPGVEDFSTITRGVCPYGPGIDWFRFFLGAQGTFGVITWMQIKIEYIPTMSKLFFLSFKDIEDAIEILYRIQRRAIGHECLLLNRINLATILSDGSPEKIEVLKDKLPPFTIVLVLAGGKRRPEEKIAYEEEALREIGRELIDISVMAKLPETLGADKKLIEMLRNPWPEEKVYWKHLYRGGDQDLFFITTMERVPKFTTVIKEVANRHGHLPDDIGLYIQPLELGRACHCEFNLFYDSDSAKEREKTRNLYIEAAEYLIDNGALFTRPYGEIAPIAYDRAPSYAWALKKIKDYFDPLNIMNPGRLCF